MEYHNIENLLEKYNNCETTLNEEVLLKTYFTSNNVAPHLEHYKSLFTYFSEAQQEQYTKNVQLQTVTKTKIYQWLSVAAVVVIMLGIFIPNWKTEPRSLADYTKEEQKMYLETKQALAMLSNNFSSGMSSLNTLELASENFNVGIEKANHVSEFGKTTNRLLKN